MKNKDHSLVLENVVFSYKSTLPNAVNDVSFAIEHGHYVAIIGHNGSGKSTLSKIIMGVLKKTSGKILLFDKEVTDENIKEIRKKMGIVFQNPDNQFIGSTVRDDIAFGLENHMIKTEKMNDIILNVAKKVKMENFLDYEPLMLSGGQKQRVAIASVLALEPKLLIFDEVTSMLDPRGKKEVNEIILKLKKERKKTIISITHDMDEIINADRIIVMNNGQMVRFGSPQEILTDWKYLQEISLDIPFVLKIALGLRAQGFLVPETFHEKELIESLCQLYSKN